MHTIDEFRNGFHSHSSITSPTAQDAADLANWLLTDGLRLYRDAFMQETGTSIPRCPDGQLIEQAYPKGTNEIARQEARKNCYQANAAIFLKTCEATAKKITAADIADRRSEVFSFQHHSLLRNMALDAQSLLANWAALTQQVPGMYGIGKNPLHDAFQISHATEQVIYGGSTLFAFGDLATDSAIALLRVALETRLRFGFGLMGVRELATQAILPLNMSKVLEAIKVHESRFTLGVPLPHIVRLYSWSNIYVHVGLKHFVWSPIFALGYLRPLLRGGPYPGGHSVHTGICIDKPTLLAIQEETKTIYGLDPARHELLTIPPEHCDVRLKP